ncbi:hypothetical protein [Micromonospora qiuiae]|nr:hypothetical protein [Micromonospora qiuiae]
MLTPPANPWPRFAERNAAHRRARRVRVGVVAGFLAAVVGIQTNVIPLPGWVPGIAVAAPSSTLAHGPTRGSLAADEEWLSGVRRQVTDRPDPDGLWKVVNRDAIRVVYADEVPGNRLALVLVPLRLGLITTWNLILFEGPPGASPGDMIEVANDHVDIPVWTRMTGDATNGGTAVVIGPPGSTIAISSGYTYSPEGTVQHRQLATAVNDGVGVASVPASPDYPVVTTRVTSNGKLTYEGPVHGGWTPDPNLHASPEATDAMLAAAARNARGPALDRAILARFVNHALSDSRLSARDVALRLHWSGTVNGQPAALFMIQPEGGGVLAYVMHGDTTRLQKDLRLLLPADGADQRPIAWRMHAEGLETRTNQVMVVAPSNAATVAITIDGGAPIPVTLDASGYGTTEVPPSEPATVTAFAADGTTLASTPVPQFETDTGGLPGDSPQTRIVE